MSKRRSRLPESHYPEHQYPGSIAVLTVKQPWSQLLINARRLGDFEQKKTENRVWATTYRGELIIHAGKSDDIVKRSDTSEWNKDCLVYGAAIGVVDLTACVDLETLRRSQDPNGYAWVLTHRYAEGPICWCVDRPREFKVPVPLRGQLGVFFLDRKLFPELDSAVGGLAAGERRIVFGEEA